MGDPKIDRWGTGGEPRVLLRHQSRLRNCASALRVLLSGRTPKPGGWVRFFDPHPMRLWRPRRKRSVTTSLLVHFAVIFFILRMPWGMLFNDQSHVTLPLIQANAPIFFPLPPHKVEIHSRPKSAAKGRRETAKAAPSHGARRAAGAGLKKPSPAPKFTLVLKPPHADNHEQTIIEAGTPPDLRIHHYVPLPNVLLAGITTPHDLQVPTAGPAPKAVRKPTPGAAAMNVPAPVIPDMALAVQVPNQKQPVLASPEVALPLPAPEQALGSIYATKRKGTGSRNARGLLVMGANPTPPTNLMSLPVGNRYGAFSVSLLGGKTGVPSGPGGPAMGAGGTANAGAANAAGKGAGNGAATISGDVGADAEGASAVAAFGPTSNGSGNAEGVLPPWMAKNLVYPVMKAANIPKINLIVTAGPIGGGGLGAYGVLDCSTVYTIYLSMPGKPWVLQYCRHKKKAPDAPPKADPATATVHFGAGISPPWALKKFDFHRPPIARYKRDRMIVLRGEIAKDGTVKGLKVYQGVGSIADEAALAAFGRWKFHPATRADGKPTAVEMLVGIPATTPK